MCLSYKYLQRAGGEKKQAAYRKMSSWLNVFGAGFKHLIVCLRWCAACFSGSISESEGEY